MRVSVVIPALNAGRFIETALMSLLSERGSVPLDIVYPGRIGRQRALLVREPAIGAVYGLMQMFSVLDEATRAPAANTPTRIIRGPYLQSSMYRAEVIRAVGPFDESFRQGDDTDF